MLDHRRSRLRTPFGIAAAFSLLLAFQGTALPRASAADARSSVGITKTNNLDGKPLEPGDDFIYTLTGHCSGLTVDCVDFTVTDTLPAGLEVTSLPQSNTSRDVTYVSATRKLTIVYKQQLQNPAGETGLRAGQSGSVEVGMRLPADTRLTDGTVITNTAQVTATNADPAKDSTDVTVSIPRVVKPVATKSWADGSAVAGTGEESTLTLGVRNNSSSSAQVTQLTVSDENQQTFEYFDFESATVTAFPAGADQARLVVTTADGATHTGAVITSPGPLPLPTGVAAGDVVGFEVVFTNSKGDPLPYDSTGGTVTVKLKLRDTTRSDGQPLRPTDKVTVSNCATPSAVDKVDGTVNGTQACASYDILPDTLVLNGTKSFFPDDNGDYSHQSSEHAVVGENSPVSAVVDVTNESPFPVKSVTITEPAPGQPSDLDKVDIFVNLPTETTYFYQDLDQDGERLTGKHAYTLTFPAGALPPVQGFWSVTLYNEHHFFHPNDLHRYSLGTKNTTLRTNADGSLTLHAGAKPPADDQALANWLPAPDGPFSLYLRAYWPHPTALDGTWQPPAVTRTAG